MSAKLTVGILLIVFPFFLPAQDFNTQVQLAVDLANKGEHIKSLEIGKTLYDLQPDTPQGYNIIAYNQICLGKLEEAAPYLSTVLQLAPTEHATYVNMAYYFALMGDTQSSKKYFLESIKFYPEGFDLNLVLDEIRSVGVKRNQSALFSELANYYQQTWKVTNERYPKMADLIVAIRDELADNPEKVKQITLRYAEKFNALGWRDVAIEAYGYASTWLRIWGYLSDATEMAQAGYREYLKKDFRNNYFMVSFLLNQLIVDYGKLGNDERLVQHLNELMALSDKLPVHYWDVWAYIHAANAYYRLFDKDTNMKWAVAAYNLAQKAGFSVTRAMAADALSTAYAMRLAEGGGPQAVQYAEEALQIASDHKLTSYMSSIVGNLGLRYTSVPTRESHERAIYTLGKVAAIEEKEKQYGDAAATLNNVGAILYMDGNYENAAGYFERSVGFAQNEIDGLNLSAKDKLTFYQSQVGAYSFLTSCYANLNNPEGVFHSMERSRSRVLGERMAKGKSVEASTLSDLQEMLQTDEACIMYSLYSGHEVVILVVTKKSAQVIFHKDDSFIGNIKDKYLDRMNQEHRARSGRENEGPVDRNRRVTTADFQKVTQLTRKFFEAPGMADDVLTEYLKGYYRFLILPVANRLTSIKKLLISPDDVLNFIPFEALRQHDGKYLVEKFDVKYMHSTGVLKQIRNRQYGEGRKPLLAMGGAQFQQMKVDVPAIKTQEDINALQLEVEANEKSGKSQRKAYAALFGLGPMNALPGTVEEIKSISKTIPSSDVYLGVDMSENRIKSLAESGMLSQYKVLHLATHGFVVNDIPDLSGVAMSIFETEQGGEDGFLNVNEIGALGLKADLTVLSACQTALGKIYSGEGVTGLTQSLLIAGSNGALVSLWPVNDTSTMIFMSELYKESSKGKSYAQIVNDLKRRFIQGEFGEPFRHPNFWAPFVYFGN